MMKYVRILGILLFCSASSSAQIRFQEVADSGITIRYTSGSRDCHDLPEIMGGGVALIDGDGDGWLDLFFCNGGPIGESSPAAKDLSPCRYYRNLGGMRFADQTERANIPGPSYAMGTAVGDFDNDGKDDLFVTGWRDQRLYRNLGDGRFEDVTHRTNLESKLWSTSAAWADLDADGDLDLYVATYLEFDPEKAPYCAAPDGRRDYCGPEDFSAQPDRLYRNNGDGSFTDVSKSAGVDLKDGRGLGVVVADLVGDRRPDIFVANDGTACHLFENLGALKFREVAGPSGVAFDGQGQPLAGMGVAAGDLDGDGSIDLVVGNFFGRSTVAYLNRGKGVYLDASTPLGITSATRSTTGFGIALSDFDHDGRLDLIQANGHVLDRARLGVPSAMRPTLLRNAGKQFEDVGKTASPWFSKAILGRGLAVGDLDNDGDLDVVVTSLDAPVTLLKNETDRKSLVVELVGKRTQPFGARLRASIDGREYVRVVVGGGGYLSSSDRRIILGPGKLDQFEVVWPSGESETFRDFSGNKAVRIVEGTGRRH